MGTPSFIFDPRGTRVIISTPQHMTTSSMPEATMAAPRDVACWLEPHCESTVVAATSSGSPWDSQAMRAMLKDCSPTWETQPPTTCPTFSGAMPLRSSAAFCTAPSRSAGIRPASPLPRLPMGLRTASTM